MFKVQVGTTNFDGTGSAQNLTNEHTKYTAIDFLEQLGDDFQGVFSDNFFASYSQDYGVTVSASSWNAAGAKEVSIDLINEDVMVYDFVDVDINGSFSQQDVTYSISNAKRGNIESGAGNDSVFLYVETNNAGWSNLFTIDTAAGNDYISVANSANSRFTSYDIDAGTGNDEVFLFTVEANVGEVQREVDLGAGDDLVIGSLGDDYIITGEGSDIVYAEAGNDVIVADQNDFVDGESGFDAVIVTEQNQIDLSFRVVGEDNLAGVTGVEAIVGQQGVDQQVTVDIQDGLVVALGGDEADTLSFTWGDDFVVTASEAEVANVDELAGLGIDAADLQAFDVDVYGEQYTVFTDSAIV